MYVHILYFKLLNLEAALLTWKRRFRRGKHYSIL